MIEKYILDDDDLLKCQIVLLQNAIRHKINVKENQNKLNFIVQFLNEKCSENGSVITLDENNEIEVLTKQYA